MIDPSHNAQRLIRFETSERSMVSDQDPLTQHIVQDRIGRQLREMYSDLMEQPLPAQLAFLLSRLDCEPAGERE
jgi:hypothetical protein